MLYHGSGETVIFPEIRKTRYTKDFIDILLYKEWTGKWIIKRKMMFFMYVPLLNLLQDLIQVYIIVIQIICVAVMKMGICWINL